MDQQQPEDAGHLGGEVDDVLAQLERGGASDVLPGGLLLRPRDRAEQADVGGARLPRQAGQWNRDEDWLKIKVFPFHIFLTKTIALTHLMELPLPWLNSNHPAHLATTNK